MTTDKTPATLATVKHGGCVQLGDGHALAEHITDHLCANDYDIGGRPELLACVAEAIASNTRDRFETWARLNGHTLTRSADGEYCFISVRNLWSSWQAALSAQPSSGGQGALLRNRTPADYAIEHAGYLATAAQRLLDARGELDALVMRREEEDDVEDGDMHAAQECVDEASTGVRTAIYDFEKRRDRALAARQPVCATVKDSLTVGSGLPVGEPVCFIHPRDADRLRAKECVLRQVGTYWSRISDAIPVYLGQPAQAVDLGRDAAMFRNAMRLLTNFDVNRYLISCADGRQNGALKAHHHIALCTAFVAALTGEIHDSARMRHPELYEAIHSATQDALTDRMDEVIGFPLSGRSDYDTLAPKFFDVFFDAAMATLNDSQAVGNGTDR